LVKVGITVFPGSNCDRDVYHVLKNILNIDTEYIWYKSSVGNFDSIIIPGGFTYGDRLRAGAIAAHSPMMDKISDMAEKNVPILGICNGFQILVEAGLLPGALILNDSLKFVCKWTNTIIINNKTPFTLLFKDKQRLSIPIAHGEGKFVIDPGSLKNIQQNNQIAIQYVGGNPNGSVENIAAICSTKGNVMGMMPHPERGSDSDLIPAGYEGNSILIFKSLINYLK
ncbi:MAG TPA: phosphoribosylformylglycinamidine synthase subunit PurQ, partial [Candidatus Nitrosocosmicus sp.]|nr:phosphoribosylformylglycinamidine synthase subunit PurQ [Candidatus Nitrosocosmicus sp.]